MLIKFSEYITENNSRHFFFKASLKKPGEKEEGRYYNIYSQTMHGPETLFRANVKADHPDEIRALVRQLNHRELRQGRAVGVKESSIVETVKIGKNTHAAVGKLMNKNGDPVFNSIGPSAAEKAIAKVSDMSGNHRSNVAYKAEKAYKDRLMKKKAK